MDTAGLASLQQAQGFRGRVIVVQWTRVGQADCNMESGPFAGLQNLLHARDPKAVAIEVIKQTLAARVRPKTDNPAS